MTTIVFSDVRFRNEDNISDNIYISNTPELYVYCNNRDGVFGRKINNVIVPLTDDDKMNLSKLKIPEAKEIILPQCSDDELPEVCPRILKFVMRCVAIPSNGSLDYHLYMTRKIVNELIDSQAEFDRGEDAPEEYCQVFTGALNLLCGIAEDVASTSFYIEEETKYHQELQDCWEGDRKACSKWDWSDATVYIHPNVIAMESRLAKNIQK